MTTLTSFIATFLAHSSDQISYSPLDSSLTIAERRVVSEVGTRLMKVFRGHPAMGEVRNDPRLRHEKKAGTSDPDSHPNWPAYGFGRTRRLLFEPVDFAHAVVMLIQRRGQPLHSLPPLDPYQVDFLHYFSYIDLIRPDIPSIRRNDLEPDYGVGLSLDELAFPRTELTSNQMIDKWYRHSETLYQDNGCDPIDIVPLCQFEFTISTYLYTWVEENTNVEKYHLSGFVAPSYQQEWNSPGLYTPNFSPSGAIHDSRLESTWSILIDDHDRYLDHVVRDAPYRIDCSIMFEYDVEVEVELGGEVFTTFYRDRVWRNDPELTIGEIATYLIRRVMPTRYGWSPEKVGKAVMDKLTRRFYIQELIQHDTKTGEVKSYPNFKSFDDTEFILGDMGSATKYCYEGWLCERSTGLRVSGGTAVTHGEGMRNPIEDTALGLWFYPGGKFRQKVWALSFRRFKRKIIATTGSEWRPQLDERIRWCYEFFPRTYLDLTGVPAIQRRPPTQVVKVPVAVERCAYPFLL